MWLLWLDISGMLLGVQHSIWRMINCSYVYFSMCVCVCVCVVCVLCVVCVGVCVSSGK